jgi:hypothetical protein
MNVEDTLIRLETKSSDALFDCSFQDDIVVEPNAQIALRSVCLETPEDSMFIDGSNDKITFSLNDRRPRDPGSLRTYEIYAKHGRLRKSTQELFLQDLTDSFNGKLTSRDNAGNMLHPEVGSQMRVTIDRDSRITFESKRSQLYTTLTAPAGVHGVNVTLPTPNDDPATHEITKVNNTAASGDITQNYFGFLEPVNRGCGSSIVRVMNLTDDGDGTSGFIMGLTRHPDKIRDGSITTNDLAVAIRLNRPTDAVFIKKQGAAFVSSGVTPVGYSVATQNNLTLRDQYAIQIQAGEDENVGGSSVHFFQYNNIAGAGGRVKLGESVITLRDENTNEEINYYFVVGLLGAVNNTSINFPRTHLDPYKNGNTELFGSKVENLTAPEPPANNPSEQLTPTVTFDSIKLANFLGFPYLDLYTGQFTNMAEGQTAVIRFLNGKMKYKSPNFFSNSFIADNCIVQLLNININSYDALKNGRSNILGFIPLQPTQINDEESLIVYQPSELLYLGLKNDSKLLLKNIRARIVYTDYTDISVRGISSLNLVLRNFKK